MRPPGRHRHDRQGAANAKEREKPVAQEFVDHSAVPRFDDFDHRLEKSIQDLHGLARLRRGAHRGKGTNIRKHDRYDLLDATEPGIAGQNLLRRLSPNMKTERSPKLVLFTKFKDHSVEFPDEQPEFIHTSQGNLNVKLSLRNCPSRAAQVVDRLHHQAANQDRRTEPESDSDTANKHCKPLRTAARSGRCETQEKQ